MVESWVDYLDGWTVWRTAEKTVKQSVVVMVDYLEQQMVVGLAERLGG